MKVKVNKEECIGCGLCNSLCPSVFDFDDEGKASVVAQPSVDDEGSVQEAASSCPVAAIVVE